MFQQTLDFQKTSFPINLFKIVTNFSIFKGFCKVCHGGSIIVAYSLYISLSQHKFATTQTLIIKEILIQQQCKRDCYYFYFFSESSYINQTQSQFSSHCL